MPAIFSHVEISRKRDASASTDRSALAGCLGRDRKVLWRAARAARHTWSLEQRVILCVFKRWFLPSFKDIQFVFNAHYASSINEQNPGHQIGRNVILAQLHEMERQGEYNEAWRGVMLDTDFEDPHRHYEDTRLDLEATAIGIGIV